MIVIAHLAPGTTPEQASADVQSAANQIAAANPQTNEGYGGEIVPLREQIVGDIGPTLWTLLGAVALILLIGCANVANLLLARGGAREKEIAVRISLGATRGRLIAARGWS